MQPARLGARACSFAISALLGMLVLAPSSRAQTAQTVLETPQQTNERIRARSAAAAVSAVHDYVIGRGDVINLDVFDVPELSRDLRVSQTGSVGIPLVPVRLQIAGLTEIQAQQKIAEVLEANGLVSHPQVTVSVKERKSKPITIVGAVMHPMVYQADRPMTLVEILAEAGGISTDAGDTVILTRPAPESSATVEESASEPPPLSPDGSAAAAGVSGAPSQTSEPPPLGNTITVNLNTLLEAGDVANNIPVQAGDVITVPHAGIVYVLGAVGKPGGFIVSNDRTQLSTLKVLSLAGGLSRAAKSEQAVIIRRDVQGHQHEVPVDLRKIMARQTEDVRLQPSDVLFVPTSGGKQALIRAAEIGLGVGSAAAIFRLANR